MRCTAAMPHPIAVMWGTVFSGCNLGRLLGTGFLHGRLLGVGFLHGRLLGVGPGDSRPGEGGPMLCMLEGLNGLKFFSTSQGESVRLPVAIYSDIHADAVNNFLD